jgi:hypothetical protein
MKTVPRRWAHLVPGGLASRLPQFAGQMKDSVMIEIKRVGGPGNF